MPDKGGRGVGLVYISDRNNDLVKVFTLSGHQVCQFGGNGNRDGELNKPIGIAVNPDGDIFVSDRNNDRIQKFGSNPVSSAPDTALVYPSSESLKITKHLSYPNPFSPNGDGRNDSAKIRFELSEEAVVSVQVMDQIGRPVYSFAKRTCSAGVNELVWDGRNTARRAVGNGVYFYHIRARTVSGKTVSASGSLVVLK